jgi:hypothetical protein
MSLTVHTDPKVDFRAFHVRSRSKTDMRLFVATHALPWLQHQHRRGSSGAVMVDIDDTLIDGNENVVHGFQYMKALYNEVQLLFPLYVVTARPDEDRDKVMKMLHRRGFCIPIDRLLMLPTEHYNKDLAHVERFKWRSYLEIAQAHDGVVARFGDKLWDVAHHASLHTYLSHVKDRDCYMFVDPNMKGTVSYKLPGA